MCAGATQLLLSHMKGSVGAGLAPPVLRSFGRGLPRPCYSGFSETWTVSDTSTMYDRHIRISRTSAD